MLVDARLTANYYRLPELWTLGTLHYSHSTVILTADTISDESNYYQYAAGPSEFKAEGVNTNDLQQLLREQSKYTLV